MAVQRYAVGEERIMNFPGMVTLIMLPIVAIGIVAVIRHALRVGRGEALQIAEFIKQGVRVLTLFRR
ncbi:MAG: hypothetical protein ACE1ZF_00550 [Gemmatimonadales bacterium]